MLVDIYEEEKRREEGRKDTGIKMLKKVGMGGLTWMPWAGHQVVGGGH